MTGTTFLTLIATVLAVESGSIEINAGAGTGLLIGDRGAVLADVADAEEGRDLVIGPAEVIATSQYTARLRVDADLDVHPGSRVRFEIPRDRSTVASGEAELESRSVTRVGRLNGACLKVRTSPNLLSPPIACISEGSPVLVLDATSDWRRARLIDGSEGWLAAKFLETSDQGVDDSTGSTAVAALESLSEPAEGKASEESVSADQAVERPQERARRLELELESTRANLTEVDTERMDLEKRLAKTQVLLGEANRESERALREQAKAEAALAEQNRRISELHDERSALALEITQRNSRRKSDLRRDLVKTQKALAVSQREGRDLEAALAARDKAIADSEARIAILESEIDRLSASHPTIVYQSSLEQTQRALIQVRRESAELERLLNEEKRRSLELETQLADVLRDPAAFSDVAGRDDSDGSLVVLESARPCLNFRAEPALESESFGCLEPGTALGALGRWEGWRYVEIPDGRAGWVSEQHIAPMGIGGNG